MPRKKLIWAAVAIVVLGLGGWRLLGHSATEADDPEHAVAGDAVVAAVAKESVDPSKTRWPSPASSSRSRMWMFTRK